MAEKITKVGIITLVKVDNYGAELQAFALFKVLQILGYDAEIIDYRYFTNSRHKETRASRPLFKMSLKAKLVHLLFPFQKRLYQLRSNRDSLYNRKKRFESFHRDNTRFSQEYRTIESLFGAKMDYDAYVVGSDQVWNPNNYTSLDPYFLKFAPSERTKISYASSFGVSSLPDRTRSYFKEALQSLDAVSVREENAVQIVDDIAGVRAQWVLDPTFLLDSEKWMSFAKAVKGLPERFVLLYEITPCPYLQKLALHLAMVIDCKVVRINRDAVRKEKDNIIHNIMDAGPAEFIWLFAHATFVVTNSFHGTAFSLIMNKRFFVVTPKRKENNSRQLSLLKLFGLEDRLITEDSPLPFNVKKAIDYTQVNLLLDLQRDKSLTFLRNTLDG